MVVERRDTNLHPFIAQYSQCTHRHQESIETGRRLGVKVGNKCRDAHGNLLQNRSHPHHLLALPCEPVASECDHQSRSREMVRIGVRWLMFALYACAMVVLDAVACAIRER